MGQADDEKREVPKKTLFVTVGSYKFDELIEFVDTYEFHDFLQNEGFSKMTMQIGEGTYVPKLIYKNKDNNRKSLKRVKYFRYKKSLSEYFKKAKLILCHAGAGTTIECLRMNKKILIVVNKKLMNNHQMEFAYFMQSFNYVDICENLRNLMEQIRKCLKKNTYATLPSPQTNELFLSDLRRCYE
ncbi:glycosyltransferase [Plasmodium gonderi]|uniref:UDP-N-acetylglucosamine transferase subunit ALG13 n=1 Tax=Plasmodium gonderi TaxID=77519 RepID=A0A1Y1JEV6_PLAGO|nr:glycosyltransferase [Plasmodium gonderi]GAW78973.1 glycosyltransferase [Plasmodium gonderi]